MTRVIIVGAGPCGILLAHYLLHRSDQYQIDIYERRNDPRKVSLSNSRTIPYGLNERGLLALRKIEGLEEAVKANCVKNLGSIFHKGNGKTLLRSKRNPTFNTNRTNLVMTLLSKLNENYNGRVNIHFNCKCTHVDFEAKTVRLERVTPAVSGKEKELAVDYDLLIGADGARSIVRTHFLNTKFFEFEQKYVQSCYKTVFLPPTSDLKADCTHFWKPCDGIAFGAVPQLDKSFIGLLFFAKEEKKVVDLSTSQEVIAFFRENIPSVSQLISESEAEAFLTRPLSPQLKIRCNQYHYGDSVLIIGDAAHAVSSSLGQGCNIAFEDVLVLSRLLDEYSDNWAEALAQFTIRRKPDAHALWELDTNVFPLSKALLTEFFLRENFHRIMNKLFPQLFSPPLRDLISEPTRTYSAVLKSHQDWVSKVKKSNEKLVKRNMLNTKNQ